MWWGALTGYALSAGVEGSTALLAGILLVWCSPVWVCAVLGLADPIVEWRAYSLVLGWALLLVTIAPAWAVYALAVAWSLQTWWRCRYLQNAETFWGRVLVENRGLGQRAINGYAASQLDQE